MVLKYYGLSCFSIKKDEAVLVTDPFDPREVGLSYPGLSADVVVYTKRDVTDKERAKVNASEGRNERGGQIVEIVEPGEYEVGDIFVRMIHNTGVVIISVDDVNICYLGLSREIDKGAKFDDLGTIHYLIVPIGNGDEFMDWKKVDSMIKEIDPGVVIPSCYKMEGMKGEYAGLKTVAEFGKEMGLGEIQTEKKLKLSPVGVGEDAQYKVVQLEQSRS